MNYAQLARPVSSLAIISASATGYRDDRRLDHNRRSRMRARYVGDLADQPDDPKVTIALSVASMSITRRIQSTGDAFRQAELLGKVSRPVPLDKGHHAPNVGYAYPRERGCTPPVRIPLESDRTTAASPRHSPRRTRQNTKEIVQCCGRQRMRGGDSERPTGVAKSLPPAGRFRGVDSGAVRPLSSPAEFRRAARTQGSLICGPVPDCARVRRCSQRPAGRYVPLVRTRYAVNRSPRPATRRTRPSSLGE
jgi:hypothetical protein